MKKKMEKCDSKLGMKHKMATKSKMPKSKKKGK